MVGLPQEGEAVASNSLAGGADRADQSIYYLRQNTA
jgi:hypothetical protein